MLEEMDTLGEKPWMPKSKYPKTKNATHKRVNFNYPNHHPRKVQGSDSSGGHHVHQQNTLHKHNLKTPKIHYGRTHLQYRGNNTTRIYKTSQKGLHVAGLQVNKYPCGREINLHQREPHRTTYDFKHTIKRKSHGRYRTA